MPTPLRYSSTGFYRATASSTFRRRSAKALGKADEGSPDSLRIDIPKDDVDPKSRRIDGVKYVDTEQWQAMKSILALVDEAVAQAGKK